jgi:hypothetical protein
VRQNIAGKGVTGKILKRKGMAAAGNGPAVVLLSISILRCRA